MQVHRQYHRYLTPLSHELRKKGLNLNESLILLSLFFEPQDKISPSDLQSVLSLSGDQISQALAALEKVHLISREIDSIDRRKRRLHITTKGRKLGASLIKSFDHHENLLENNQ